MVRTSRREKLLEAAARIVRREGADAPTLDAVAAEADTGEGGPLYHFGSEDALVAGLVELLVRRFEERLAQTRPRAGEGRGTSAEAYVRASPEGGEGDDDVSAALIAAVTRSPALLDPLRERYGEWAEASEREGGAPADALLVRPRPTGCGSPRSPRRRR